MKKSIEDSNLLAFIAENFELHSHESEWWRTYSEVFFLDVKNLNTPTNDSFRFGELGTINFPFQSFGSVNTTNLFNLDELIIFSWYFKNKNRYKRVLDLGANTGLHSLIMSKIGFMVEAYEPDPVHFKLLERVVSRNLPLNSRILIHEKAVSNLQGKAEFIQMLDNTTGSHISGAKSAPYGKLKKIFVDTVAVDSILSKKFDFVKMDVEGSEIILLSALSKKNILKTEFMIEIGNPENARLLLVELDRLELNAFSQKNNWAQVRSIEDVPTSHRDGSLFLTAKSNMDWM
jgi:FkbM family methyltransferase